MNPNLPPAVSAALETLLEGVSRRELGARAAKVSAAYRAGQTSRGIESPLDTLAYLTARMPATYAACAAAFARTAEAMPGFAPRSLLDVGAGPGTAAFAAQACWPSLAGVTLLEHNAAFRAVAARLLPQAAIIAGDLGSEPPKADLVTASYVLAELPQACAAATARHLWDAAQGALLLIEPGTPAGFARIRAARQALIASGGHVAAPCTHDNQCPMTGRSVGESQSDQQKDWCHFSQRLARSRDHMAVKDGSVPFEDERYAYVAVTRQPVARHGARILAPPLEAKPGLTFKLCDETGLHTQFVPSRDKDAYRRVRKKAWGDLLEN